MLLVAGILLWSLTHLSIALAPQGRQKLIDALGLIPYKLAFSMVLVIALVLLVMGWRQMPPTSVWVPPAAMRHLTMLLVPIAAVLFIAGRLPTDLKRWIRHPQLTAVKLWAVAHLLANGELRSILLFGGLLVWAVLEVILINRRQGARIKPPAAGTVWTLASTGVGVLLAAILMWAHPWIAGVPLMAVR